MHLLFIQSKDIVQFGVSQKSPFMTKLLCSFGKLHNTKFLCSLVAANSSEDHIFCLHSYARLAIQMENNTNAQANVQIGVPFGKRGIRHALNRSLNEAEVIWLSSDKNFIAKGQFM